MTETPDMKMWSVTVHDLGENMIRVLEGIAGDGIQGFKLRPHVQPSQQVTTEPSAPTLDGESELSAQTEEEAELVQNILAALFAGTEQPLQRTHMRNGTRADGFD